jgi:predicted metalloprotease
MRWRGRRESQNIEDRRGENGAEGYGGLPGGFRLPGGAPTGGGIRIGGGRGGIGILIVAAVILWFLGINPLVLIDPSFGPEPSGRSSAPTQTPRLSPGQQQASGASDEMKRFVAVVLAETEDVWNGIFQASGRSYQEPTLVLFSGQTVAGACGYASAASGPFYCPGDRRVYLDTAFFGELSRRFGAPGDFADAYVVAHEVGHHVQNLIGVLPKFNEMRQRMSQAEANAMSVRVELQADCFAGVWAHRTEQKGIVEAGDIEEALNAAQQIGDDTLQKRTQGYVVPESFNHGTSAQRMRWFKKGFDSGSPDACDTFGASSL